VAVNPNGDQRYNAVDPELIAWLLAPPPRVGAGSTASRKSEEPPADPNPPSL
jgi:hypothetical protein